MTTASGVFFWARTTGRYLYLLRSDTLNWSIPGGKCDAGETLLENIVRECEEEISYFPADGKLIPIEKFTNEGFTYHTFFCCVEQEFTPQLNEEHCGYAWVAWDYHPKPLHRGLQRTVNHEVVIEKLFTLTASQK